MKVLQAIIITLFIVGCAAPEGTTEATDVSSNEDTTPDNQILSGGDAACTTVCPAGEAGQDGAPGIPGTDGLDGSSCSVVQSGGNATIGCTDGTSATLEGGVGTIGPQGPMGVQGPAGPAGPAGATGSMGPTGPQGSAGPKGAPGADGKDGVLTAGSVYVRIHDQTAQWAQAVCDAGDFAIGGGCRLSGSALDDSSPITGDHVSADGETPDSWMCQSLAIARVTARVICVDVTP